MSTTQNTAVQNNSNQIVPATHASLYVGDLDEDVSEAMIYERFSKIGTIVSIRVCRDMISRRSLGYAYVNFATNNEAAKAIDELNFETLKGKRMRIMWSQRDPSLRKSGVGNLFIKNLDKNIQDRDLYDTFSTIGEILSLKIPCDENGNSKGYGFVHFVSKEVSDIAVTKLNGTIMMDKKIYVGYFVPKSQRSNTSPSDLIFNNVFVKNFGEDVTEEILTNMFESFGEITSLYVPINLDTKKSRGFGFVCFKDPKSAANAVEGLNQKDYNGRVLFVGKAMKKSERLDILRSRFERLKSEKSQRYASGVNLYVKNLEDSIDDEILKKEFSFHGNITSVKVMTDNHGRSKGFGFVCFSFPDEATKAVTEMNGKILFGKPIYVALAQRKEERRAHLQNQMLQRMTYRPYPPGFPGNVPFGSSSIGNHFPSPAGQIFMYPGYASQPNHSQLYVLPNRIMHHSIQGQQAPRSTQRWPGSNIPTVHAPPTNILAHSGMFNEATSNTAVSLPRYSNQINHFLTPMPAVKQSYNNVVRQPAVTQQSSTRSEDGLRGSSQLNSEEINKFTSEFHLHKETVSRKQFLGEKLFEIINKWYPNYAGKITGMILEIDDRDVVDLVVDELSCLPNKVSSLKGRVDAARNVLLASGKPEAHD